MEKVVLVLIATMVILSCSNRNTQNTSNNDTTVVDSIDYFVDSLSLDTMIEDTIN